LNNLKNGRYTLSIYRVGYQHNDPFTAYIKMGRPYNLSRSQEQQIRTISEGKPESSIEITITNGTFQKKLELMSNDVYFITLHKK
jgi:xylan 1,4-beta-xylosidase